MRQLSRRWVGLLLFGIGAALLGCSGGPRQAPVEGKVLADGKALTRGSVAFHPDDKKGNTATKPSGGDIAENGAYKVFTDGKPGAPLGWYRVTVVSQSEADSANPEAVKSFVGEKYSDPARTPLSIEVTAAPAAGAYDLKVSAK